VGLSLEGRRWSRFSGESKEPQVVRGEPRRSVSLRGDLIVGHRTAGIRCSYLVGSPGFIAGERTEPGPLMDHSTTYIASIFVIVQSFMEEEGGAREWSNLREPSCRVVASTHEAAEPPIDTGRTGDPMVSASFRPREAESAPEETGNNERFTDIQPMAAQGHKLEQQSERMDGTAVPGPGHRIKLRPHQSQAGVAARCNKHGVALRATTVRAMRSRPRNQHREHEAEQADRIKEPAGGA